MEPGAEGGRSGRLLASPALLSPRWTFHCWVDKAIVWGSAGRGAGWSSFPDESREHTAFMLSPTVASLFPSIHIFFFNQTIAYLEVSLHETIKPTCLSLKRPISIYIQRQAERIGSGKHFRLGL